MKAKVIHTYDEGPQAADRFKTAVKTILAVPRSEMERREKQYQKEAALKPKRGRSERLSLLLPATVAPMIKPASVHLLGRLGLCKLAVSRRFGRLQV